VIKVVSDVSYVIRYWHDDRRVLARAHVHGGRDNRCQGTTEEHAKRFRRSARRAGVSSFTKLKGQATIRGIGFFDFFHTRQGSRRTRSSSTRLLRFMDATCEVVQ
jgi:hypothetical protein